MCSISGIYVSGGEVGEVTRPGVSIGNLLCMVIGVDDFRFCSWRGAGGVETSIGKGGGGSRGDRENISVSKTGREGESEDEGVDIS